MELKIGGKYLTRDGDTVVITSNDGDNRYPWIGSHSRSGREDYSTEGCYHYSGDESGKDLIEKISELATEPAPFTMDARATMAMHFMAQMRGEPKYAFMASCAVEAADALIAELTKGKTE